MARRVHLHFRNEIVSLESIRGEISSEEISEKDDVSLRLSDVMFVEDDENDDADEARSAIEGDAAKPNLINLEIVGDHKGGLSILDDALSRIFARNTPEKLRFSFRTFTMKDMDALQQMLKRCGKFLRELTLQHMLFESDDAIDMLLESLRFCSKLRSLELIGCDMESTHCSTLSKAIHSLSTLQRVCISHNNIDASGIEALTCLGFAEHPRLDTIDLSFNPIGDEGAMKLSQFLTSSSCWKIQNLYARECEIWEDGCDTIAESLARFRSLRTLVLCDDFSEHLSKVARSLETNMILTHLGNVCSETNRETEKKIIANHSSPSYQVDYYLRLNRANRNALMKEAFTSPTWLEAVEKASGDVGVLYYVLRQRPEVMDVEQR